MTEADGPEAAGPEAAGLLGLHAGALRMARLAGAFLFPMAMIAGTVGAGLGVARTGIVSPTGVLVALLWLVFVGVLGFFCFAWPGLRHRRIAYRLDEAGLQILRGVLWRSHVFVTRSRVQHTNVVEGPLQRRFGVATLVVHTAGTRHSATRLGGVGREEAFRLRDLLMGGSADAPWTP